MDLKKLREENKLSQADLARKAGMAQSSISYLERGEKNPSINTAMKLANAFQMELSDLLRS